ncbi:hypothetical protein GCM10010168_53600 [Actinoplanes ianthinogenes]|uniref:Transporter (Transmembrane protein) n=1 Tax=Actinoplanes ianthinogenes TaxID=122358 RepID=A0ABN6C8T7_9ACTN|nr:hypothetical protein [Actinoplanes ianthinogenes]BCJ41642.1 hypothetical protein Aiant_22990 [Actinoplanes ianthinogenes]GGR28715.1 hypothetical protein GCM10010168_53600 [Actinoplanes ianthinogenes]
MTGDGLSRGLSDMWRSLVLYLPVALAFVAVLLIGWLLARLARTITAKALRRVGLDRAAQHGLAGRLLRGTDPVALCARLAYWLVLLITLQLAFGLWGPNQVSTLLNTLIAWLPQLFVAIVIVVAAIAVAGAAHDLIGNALGELGYARVLAKAVAAVIITLGVIAGLDQVGIATTVTRPLLITVLVTVAGVIIVGVGGGLVRPMQQRWEGWLDRAAVESAAIREQARAFAEERARQAEARAEAERRAEEARKAEEARRAEEARKAEEARRAEEDRKAEEARRAEQERKAEEARRLAEAKQAEEARQAAAARRAEEERRAEETRQAEERRRAEEARRAEIERRQREAWAADQRRAAAAQGYAARPDDETQVIPSPGEDGLHFIPGFGRTAGYGGSAGTPSASPGSPDVSRAEESTDPGPLGTPGETAVITPGVRPVWSDYHGGEPASDSTGQPRGETPEGRGDGEPPTTSFGQVSGGGGRLAGTPLDADAEPGSASAGSGGSAVPPNDDTTVPTVLLGGAAAGAGEAAKTVPAGDAEGAAGADSTGSGSVRDQGGAEQEETAGITEGSQHGEAAVITQDEAVVLPQGSEQEESAVLPQGSEQEEGAVLPQGSGQGEAVVLPPDSGQEEAVALPPDSEQEEAAVMGRGSEETTTVIPPGLAQEETAVITQGSEETTTVIPSPGPDRALVIDETGDGDRTQVVSLPGQDQTTQEVPGHPGDDDPTIPSSRPAGG